MLEKIRRASAVYQLSGASFIKGEKKILVTTLYADHKAFTPASKLVTIVETVYTRLSIVRRMRAITTRE